MSTHQEQPTGTGAPGGDWWSRRPRRSGADRKIAGVAGGLGRTFGVDPVLIRVAFVVLTIFGGFGLTLYVLGWLLLPADGDEVSPGEALLGRGRSATPPVLAVGLAVVAAISIMSMFSWGLPFWPLVIAGVVVVLVARNKGRSCTRHTAHGGTPWVDQWAAKATETGRSWGEQAEQWVARQPWSGTSGERPPGQQQQAPSPFEQPAFWDEQRPAAADPTRVNLRKDAPAGPAEPPAPPAPPAWDPLGVAPFAWDLPEPAAAPAPPAPRDRNVIGRITLGMVLLVGGLAAVGSLQGWWALSWAGVAAVALTIVAVGLLIASLRGQGRSLIGPGIFLSLVTLALTITGINGTTGYGQQTWAPTTVAAATQDFELNGGQGTLDLRQLDLRAGQTVDTELTVRAGQATVIVPSETAVNLTCTANAGEIDCLGERQDGLHQEITTSQDGSSDNGTINLTVHVGAGQATVRHG
ncbi:PspC domain-containing protein [Nakamurella sp.]|uniref:PspC domain-containing protein n=1 Tax=Nakamurella sp. TaxID=1869182 RepID=UPI003B3AD7BB